MVPDKPWLNAIQPSLLGDVNRAIASFIVISRSITASALLVLLL
jgi:hypothetical protein